MNTESWREQPPTKNHNKVQRRISEISLAESLWIFQILGGAYLWQHVASTKGRVEKITVFPLYYEMRILQL